MKTKPVATIATMEQERDAMRMELEKRRDHLQDMQRELASQLARQRGLAASRAPLVTALDAAQRTVQDAQDALARNLGKSTEDQFSEKLYQATQEKEKAAQALKEFDSQVTATSHEQIQQRRADLQKAEEELKQLEARAGSLSMELDQAIEKERTVSLIRLISTFDDLFTILETDGHTLARMRNYDPVAFHYLMQDLLLTPEDLWNCIQQQYSASGPTGFTLSDENPYLKERQRTIKERLARLRK
jgi:DNA repair exonuclease SbcCD ATPase subunit